MVGWYKWDSEKNFWQPVRIDPTIHPDAAAPRNALRINPAPDLLYYKGKAGYYQCLVWHEGGGLSPSGGVTIRFPSKLNSHAYHYHYHYHNH